MRFIIFRYFQVIFFSLSISNCFSQEFSSDDCHDYIAVNVKLDNALTKDSISKKKLPNSTRIVAEIPFTVVSFTYVFDGCEMVEREVKSNGFAEIDKNVFQKLRSGNLLCFEKIKAIDGNGKTVYLKPFCYRIY